MQCFDQRWRWRSEDKCNADTDASGERRVAHHHHGSCNHYDNDGTLTLSASRQRPTQSKSDGAPETTTYNEGLGLRAQKNSSGDEDGPNAYENQPDYTGCRRKSKMRAQMRGSGSGGKNGCWRYKTLIRMATATKVRVSIRIDNKIRKDVRKGTEKAGTRSVDKLKWNVAMQPPGVVEPALPANRRHYTACARVSRMLNSAYIEFLKFKK
ncbi:hypothetical protein BC830DRAFT_1189896 [Chytriomyces sp. MP71]|nr:hypothetical protein BC830DRAFT_1189896 [Chytriomyces sp. MP71]